MNSNFVCCHHFSKELIHKLFNLIFVFLKPNKRPEKNKFETAEKILVEVKWIFITVITTANAIEYHWMCSNLLLLSAHVLLCFFVAKTEDFVRNLKLVSRFHRF